MSQAMRFFLFVLLGFLLLAVASVLALGFYALFRGGEFGRRWSNKLMQLRVIIQFAAIAVLASIVWLSQAGRSH
jgi:Hypoxia induced protein conserved region